MAITFSSFSGTPTYVACNGGGQMMMARVNTQLTAAAASSFDATFMGALGAPQGKVVAASFCKSSIAMVVNGGADGISPYVAYDDQNLEWRNSKDGTIEEVPTAITGGNFLTLDLVVLV